MSATPLDRDATIRRMNELNYALDAYLGDVARAGGTDETVRSYRDTLWHFADFLERQGVVECDRITPELCRRFLNRWVGSSPSTQAQRWTVLNRFCRFLKAETAIPDNPMENIPRARRKRPEDLDVVTVTSQDVERMFEAADGWQEILCLAALAYLGPRRKAASRVRRSDVVLRWEDGAWRGTVKFREKGGKPIVKPLPLELVELIRAADEQSVWASPGDYLIPSRRSPRTAERSPKVIYDTVKKIAARAGVNCHAHALRAAFAVKFDEQYPDRLIALKEAMGHSQVGTTLVYLRRKDREREMESTLPGLSWVTAQSSIAPSGIRTRVTDVGDNRGDSAVAEEGSLPAVLLAKVAALRIAGSREGVSA